MSYDPVKLVVRATGDGKTDAATAFSFNAWALKAFRETGSLGGEESHRNGTGAGRQKLLKEDVSLREVFSPGFLCLEEENNGGCGHVGSSSRNQ